MKILTTNKEYWEELLKRYRTAKMLRLYKEKNNLSYFNISNLTGFSRQYIYGVEQMTIKPNTDFIKKLEKLHESI